MRRIPPYIDCILQYYLMETYGQVACTARTRGTIGGGTGGTIGGHRRHATFFTPSSEGASRSEGVGLHQPPPGSTRFLNAPTRMMETYGQVACTARTRGTIRGQKRHNPGTIDFGGVRK